MGNKWTIPIADPIFLAFVLYCDKQDIATD